MSCCTDVVYFQEYNMFTDTYLLDTLIYVEEARKRQQGDMTKGVGEMGQGRKRSKLVLKL